MKETKKEKAEDGLSKGSFFYQDAQGSFHTLPLALSLSLSLAVASGPSSSESAMTSAAVKNSCEW